MNSRQRQRQRGVALVTAMLAVATVTVLAVEMTTQQHRDVRRTQNLLARDQAYTYALAAERWALAMLIEDRRGSGDNVDHPGEPWAQVLTPPPFQGARMRLRLEDLQGRFNMNNLVAEPGVDDESAMARFSRLLAVRAVDPAFVPATADWIDFATRIRFPGGAGDDWYSRLDPPYRAANRPMVSPSELRLVRDVGDEEWRRVAPYVTALPEPTPVNVNTASVPVLRSLAPGMSAEAAQGVVDDRPDDGWQSVGAFLAHPGFAGEGIDPATLTVGSRYFVLHSEIDMGRVTIRSESVIHRSGERGQVILRRQGFFD